MGRDFEITLYFPHVPLTARLIRRLFRELAAAGLRIGTSQLDRYPVLDELSPSSRGVTIGATDVEELLRSRAGALPRGYGMIPLLGKVASTSERASGTMQFWVHTPLEPQLDGLHLRFDDGVLRHESSDPKEPVGPGWRALIAWYGIVCNHLRVAYGYGDWDDLFLMTVVPPSRRDVLAGQLDLLYRINCLGPSLVRQYGSAHLLATPADVVVALRYGGALIGGKLRYGDGDDAAFREAAAHLMLRSRANEDRPPAATRREP